MTKVERGYNPQEGREKLVALSKQYQARIISGNFDGGKPLDIGQVKQKIAENNPVEAYARMHERWEGVRIIDWHSDTRDFQDQVLGWAGGRAANLLPQLQSGANTDFLEGLKTIGLEISDPATTDKDTLKSYFAETFYPQFASQSSEDEDRSVGNLVRTFFDAARQSPEDNTSGLDAQKLSRVRAQVEALKPVLEPILKKETFEKFEDVLEARFAAANGELAGVKNGEPSVSLTNDLEYFEPTQTQYVPKSKTGQLRPTPEPTPVVVPVRSPIATPVPTPAPSPISSPWSARPAPAPVEGMPAPLDSVVLIDANPGEFILDLNNNVLVCGKNNKRGMVASVSPESLLSGEGYLLSDADGDIKVEVRDPGKIEASDGENGIKETGVTLFIEEEGRGREISGLNLSIQATEDGITVTVDDVEEMPGFTSWNRQLAQKALAGINSRLISKMNRHLEDINPGWAVTGKIIIESGRFKISFGKILDDELEPATPPPFPKRAVVFPINAADFTTVS